MVKETSAGMVVYNSKLEKYLVLEYDTHWGFVKGGIEGKETNEETAKRELKEETGIKKFELKDFKHKINYFYRKNNETVFKEVIFFLIITETEEINLSDEHKSYKWSGFSEAYDIVRFKNTREILTKAKEYLKDI